MCNIAVFDGCLLPCDDYVYVESFTLILVKIKFLISIKEQELYNFTLGCVDVPTLKDNTFTNFIKPFNTKKERVCE